MFFFGLALLVAHSALVRAVPALRRRLCCLGGGCHAAIPWPVTLPVIQNKEGIPLDQQHLAFAGQAAGQPHIVRLQDPEGSVSALCSC